MGAQYNFKCSGSSCVIQQTKYEAVHNKLQLPEQTEGQAATSKAPQVMQREQSASVWEQQTTGSYPLISVIWAAPYLGRTRNKKPVLLPFCSVVCPPEERRFGKWLTKVWRGPLLLWMSNSPLVLWCLKSSAKQTPNLVINVSGMVGRNEGWALAEH